MRAVRRSFVPVAVDRFELERAPGPAGDLWREVQRQRPHFQGVWIVSPDGKVLASQYGSSDGKVEPWKREVLRAIEAGLEKFGKVEPRAAGRGSPRRAGAGTEPDGTLRAALYCGLLRDGRREEPAATESLELSQEDLKALIPGGDEAGPGAEWTVPEDVARKFCRALSPYSEPTIVPRPEHLKVALLKGKVESFADGAIHVEFRGTFESELVGGERPGTIKASMTAEGLALRDPEKKELRSLLIVFDGKYEHHGAAPEPFRAVVEWTAEPEPGRARER